MFRAQPNAFDEVVGESSLSTMHLRLRSELLVRDQTKMQSDGHNGRVGSRPDYSSLFLPNKKLKLFPQVCES